MKVLLLNDNVVKEKTNVDENKCKMTFEFQTTYTDAPLEGDD